MQKEYNEKVAEKVTEAIRRDDTPAPRLIQELSDAHKLAENVAKAAPSPSSASSAKSVKKAAEAVLAPSKTDADLTPDAKEMLDLIAIHRRYRDTYENKITELAWMNDAQFARMNLIDMRMKLETIRTAVNAASRKANPVQTIFMIAVDALTKVSAAMAVAGVLEPSYDLTGQMTGGKNLKEVIDDGIKKGDFESELTQIWIEYADSFNMGPFKRLTLAVMAAAQEVQTQNKKNMKTTTAPPKTLPKKMADL